MDHRDFLNFTVLFHGGLGIPNAVSLRPKFFYQGHIVVPGDLCKHRLHKFFRGPVSAKARMYFRFLREKPLVSGKVLIRSAARRSITLSGIMDHRPSILEARRAAAQISDSNSSPR
jgi:hypothetical protein